MENEKRQVLINHIEKHIRHNKGRENCGFEWDKNNAEVYRIALAALNSEQQRSLDHREFLLLSADQVQREYAEALGCAGDNESILEAIDELKEQVRTVDLSNGVLNQRIAELDNSLCELLPGTQYMDPPDGGSVTPLEQVSRMIADYREKLHAAEKRIAELERSETQLIDERDNAESALNDAYKAVMGQAPEWSNWFSFADAIDEIELACGLWRNQTEDVIQFRARIAELEAKLQAADKLQDSAFRHGLQHGFSYGQTNDQAGFEQCLAAYSSRGKDNG